MMNAKELENEKQKYKKLQDEHENQRNTLLKNIESNLDSHKGTINELNEDY
jgi:DNA repair exonuclease SbcCD ATPase subunit